MISRRIFLSGLSAVIASPAIVRVTSLMPIKAEEFELLAGDFISLEQAGQRLVGMTLPFGVSSRDKLTFDHIESLDPSSVDLFVTRSVGEGRYGAGRKTIKIPAGEFVAEIRSPGRLGYSEKGCEYV